MKAYMNKVTILVTQEDIQILEQEKQLVRHERNAPEIWMKLIEPIKPDSKKSNKRDK